MNVQVAYEKQILLLEFPGTIVQIYVTYSFLESCSQKALLIKWECS